MSGLWLRLLRLLRWRASEREIDQELRLHVEMEAEKYQRAGVDSREARRRALLALGGRDRWREEVRAARGTAWLEDGVRDVRLAARGLMRFPGFAFAAISAIALGTGATTAIYSVVDQVVLSPLAYPESGELVTVWRRNPRVDTEEDVISWPNFIDVREATTTLDGLATVLPVEYTLTGDGEPEEVPGAIVSRSFFDVVGHPLALGRPFRDTEVEGDVANVVVLGHGLFTRRFGADPSIVGRTITLDDATYEVVGVTRQGAGYPRDAQFWTPQAFPPDEPLTKYPRRRPLFPVIGRLGDAATLLLAQAEMDAIAARLDEAYPETNRGVGIGLEPMHETIGGDVRTPLLVLLGAVIAATRSTLGSSSASLGRVRSAFVAAQFALALALLVGSGLFMRSFLNLRAVDPGFEAGSRTSRRHGPGISTRSSRFGWIFPCSLARRLSVSSSRCCSVSCLPGRQ
jgi:hypothetical protein